ncbi:uncharacterized protein LTR77_008585 [Saxophila tyrrhenica]|uniref:Uncharacterized protein n=1 Tax=Saxophila tyrrhenica TaxID=1690608 RepID=A0AAV9P1C6_9PEZI|nr:hypothetical protein LTR77_008585 [Saxophila tyrrhenica]
MAQYPAYPPPQVHPGMGMAAGSYGQPQFNFGHYPGPGMHHFVGQGSPPGETTNPRTLKKKARKAKWREARRREQEGGMRLGNPQQPPIDEDEQRQRQMRNNRERRREPSEDAEVADMARNLNELQAEVRRLREEQVAIQREAETSGWMAGAQGREIDPQSHAPELSMRQNGQLLHWPNRLIYAATGTVNRGAIQPIMGHNQRHQEFWDADREPGSGPPVIGRSQRRQDLWDAEEEMSLSPIPDPRG